MYEATCTRRGPRCRNICNIGATYSMPHICDNLRNMWPSLVGPTHICEHPSDAISGRYLTVGLPWHPGGHIGSWPVPRIGLRSWPSHCQIISRKTACHLWCAGYPSPQQRFQDVLGSFFVQSGAERSSWCDFSNGTFEIENNDWNMTTWKIMKSMPTIMCRDMFLLSLTKLWISR